MKLRFLPRLTGKKKEGLTISYQPAPIFQVLPIFTKSFHLPHIFLFRLFWHYSRGVPRPRALLILETHGALHELRDRCPVYPQQGKPYLKNNEFSENPHLSAFQCYSNSAVRRSGHPLALESLTSEIPFFDHRLSSSFSLARPKLSFLHSYSPEAASHLMLSSSP